MPARFHTGDVLVEKFRIVRVRGEGGMGIVYEAEHLSLGEHVAIKVLHNADDRGPRGAQRLLREARAAARIKSEHVARVNDFGTLPDGLPFLVMELVEGPSLARLLKEEGRREVSVAVRYALETCLALAEAHAFGIVHRDIKPSNLIVSRRRDGSELIKVLDFGVAKQTAADTPAMTASSGVLGSPSYMSPEQIRDAHSVDERTDIWSLGIVLYEMLTCHLPFDAFTAAGMLAAISADDPVLPTRHRPELDPRLENVVLRCLARARENRYPRVVELAEALAPFSAAGPELVERIRRLRETAHERVHERDEHVSELGDETDATQNATATTARESIEPLPSRRSRARPALVVVSVLALAGILVVLSLRSARETPAPTSPAVAATQPADRSVVVQPPATASVVQVTPAAPIDDAGPKAFARPAPVHPVQRKLARDTLPEMTPPAPAPAKSSSELDFGYRK